MLSLYIGMALGTLGKLILGFAVLRVHSLIIREHKIDPLVLLSMKHERYITMIGIFFIFLGYAIEMSFFYNAGNLS